MSGVKGRSGRRPLSEEMLRHRTILRAWELTSQKLHTSQDKDTYNTAKDIVVKDMTAKEQVDMTAHLTQEEQSILDKYIHTNRLPQDT